MKDLTQDNMPPLRPVQREGYWYQDIKILNKHGLHARPSAKFFEQVLQPHGEKLDLAFHVHGRNAENEYMPIRSVFDLMSLGLEMGTLMTVRLKYKAQSGPANGPTQEEQIAGTIHHLFLNIY